MTDRSDNLFYLGAGPILAVVLGMALTPLREWTQASNFTFAFLVLTITVAEFGGRWAALATALASALSLDFFLTRPYLRLTIEDKHDVIAFAGLTVCGLVAAALGSQRGYRLARLREARSQLDVLHRALAVLVAPGTLESRLPPLLARAVGVLGLQAAVVRDIHGHCAASDDSTSAMRPVPLHLLQPGSPIPRDGGRLALRLDAEPVGWFDVWGTDRPRDVESERALTAMTQVLALMLARAWSPAGR